MQMKFQAEFGLEIVDLPVDDMGFSRSAEWTSELTLVAHTVL